MPVGDPCPTHHDLLAVLVNPATNGNAQKVQAVTLVSATGAASPASAAPPATGTTTSVANSVANVTLLAANSARRGATIYNDDTAASLYVKLGVTASTPSFSIKLAPGGYYEIPYGYTGQVDGIASAATGNARITELA